MKKTILILSLGLMLCIGAFAQATQPLASPEPPPCQDPAVKKMRVQFHTLDPDTKAAIVSAHILKQIRTRQLTDEQKAVLAKALVYLTPLAYTEGTVEQATARAEITKLKDEFHREFSMREGATIFDRVDTDIWERYTAGRLFVDQTKAVVAKKTGKKDDPFLEGMPCNCSTSSDWCDSGSSCCYTGSPGCATCSGGGSCGTLLLYDCNGACNRH